MLLLRKVVFTVSTLLLRLAICAWIGAAALFVITSVAEQTSPEFGSVVRDQLATVRFPYYYQFGFGTHVLSAIVGLTAWMTAEVGRRRLLAVWLLVLTSGVLITLDYRYVYLPLQELIVPPGNVRTAEFMQLHNWSRHANECHVTVMFLAALLACTPLPQRSSTSTDRESAGDPDAHTNSAQ